MEQPIICDLLTSRHQFILCHCFVEHVVEALRSSLHDSTPFFWNSSDQRERWGRCVLLFKIWNLELWFSYQYTPFYLSLSVWVAESFLENFQLLFVHGNDDGFNIDSVRGILPCFFLCGHVSESLMSLLGVIILVEEANVMVNQSCGKVKERTVVRWVAFSLLIYFLDFVIFFFQIYGKEK